MQVGLTIGAPFLAAVVSGLFVAPASGMRLAGPPRLLLQVAVFGSAVTALAVTGYPRLGGAFGVVTLLDGVLLAARADHDDCAHTRGAVARHRTARA